MTDYDKMLIDLLNDKIKQWECAIPTKMDTEKLQKTE